MTPEGQWQALLHMWMIRLFDYLISIHKMIAIDYRFKQDVTILHL